MSVFFEFLKLIAAGIAGALAALDPHPMSALWVESLIFNLSERRCGLCPARLSAKVGRPSMALRYELPELWFFVAIWNKREESRCYLSFEQFLSSRCLTVAGILDFDPMW